MVLGNKMQTLCGYGSARRGSAGTNNAAAKARPRAGNEMRVAHHRNQWQQQRTLGGAGLPRHGGAAW